MCLRCLTICLRYVSHLLYVSLYVISAVFSAVARDLRCVLCYLISAVFSTVASDLRCVLCCRWWSPLCSLLSLVISAVFTGVSSDLRCHQWSPLCSGVQVNVWLSCRVLSVNHRCMFVPYVPYVPYVPHVPYVPYVPYVPVVLFCKCVCYLQRLTVWVLPSMCDVKIVIGANQRLRCCTLLYTHVLLCCVVAVLCWTGCIDCLL